MWRRRKDNLKRRMMSGILACLLVATSLTNTVGIITSFAGETANIPRVSYKYDDLKNDKGQLDKMVQINVQAENESFAPGSEMVLKVYVQNLSDQNLTGGSLKWSGKGLEEAGFLDEEEEDLFNGPGWDGEVNDSDTSDLMEELGNFSVTGLRKSVALKIDDTAAKDETEAPEQNVEIITDVETEEEEDDTSDPQTDEEGKRIRGIELAPGEVYETRFYGTVEDMDSIVTRKVTFEFLAGTDDNKVAQDKAEFTYNTGMALVLPIEFDDGPALMTNELNTMYIHTRFEDEKILDEYTWEITDEDEATPSDAERHEITVATMSNGTEDSSEGTTPANMKYSIVTYGAKLEGIEAWYDDERSGWGEMATGVSFRVKDDTEPGVYFGQVTTSIRREGKSYKTTQGFHFFVLGDGQLVLKGNINGAEIQVKGDRSSFPEGDMLSLKVTEVPAEKMDLVQEAMVQKAEELGVSVDKMKAMDIKVIADGVEQELEGEVEVTFSNLTLEKVEETIDLEDEEDIEDGEVEELEEINTNAVFGLRKASAGTEEDQVDAAGEAEMVEAENESEEKEESTLAVWHFDESQGAMDEMDSSLNDDGDLVMTTEHFSVFIVVDMEQLGGIITLRLEHWGEGIQTIQGTTDATHMKFDSAEDKTGNAISGNETLHGTGKRYGYYTEDTIFDRYTREVKRSSYNNILYSPDEIQVPNGKKYESIEELSKICLLTANKTQTEESYFLKKVLIAKDPTKLVKDPQTQEWKDGFEEYILRDNDGNEVKEFDNQGNEIKQEIKLKSDSIIRFIYREKPLPEYYQATTFYDHNISSGNKTEGNTNMSRIIKGQEYLGERELGPGEGTNIESNFSSGTAKMGVGQWNSGNNSTWCDDEFNGYFLNQANKLGNLIGKSYIDAFGNTRYYTYDNNIPNEPQPGDTKEYLNTPAMVAKGLVTGLDEDGNIIFAEGISQPGFFEAKSGTKIFNNYELGFKRTGDTYILSTVNKDGDHDTDVLSNLEQIKFSAHSFARSGNSHIFSNEFWPLDNEKYSELSYPEADAQKKGTDNDNGAQHNYHFGMKYKFKFNVGDYEGPINFYFRGDDDFWLFVDNDLVIDLGGIHSAVGEAIDLRDWLTQKGKLDKEDHTISVFFMERGGSGSCCYMQFTIPNCTEIHDSTVPTTEVVVEKEWIGDDEQFRPTSIDVTLHQKHLDENGNEVEDEVYETRTLSEFVSWKAEWKDLPLVDPNDSSMKYTYYVTEEQIEGYEGSQVIYDSTGSAVDEIGEEQKGYLVKITNTLLPVRVTFTKTWDDGNNACGSRPDDLKFQLYADGRVYNGKQIILQGGNYTGNDWTSEFTELPQYHYVTENGEKNKPIAIVYTVRETDGVKALEVNDYLKGKHGDNDYKVQSYVDQLITPTAENGNKVAHTTVTNIHRHSLEVEKRWVGVDSASMSQPYVALYNKKTGERITEKPAQQLVMQSNGRIIARYDDLVPSADGYTVKELTSTSESDNDPVKFSISIDGETRFVKPVENEEYYETYYQVKYQETGNTCGFYVTITNELRKARIRIAKWIDNWDESIQNKTESDNDLLKDDFTITVKSGAFETGVVLQHAGNCKTDELDSGKFSGYIEVIVGEDGMEFAIDEIAIPKEYLKSKKYIKYIVDVNEYTNTTFRGNIGLAVNEKDGKGVVRVSSDGKVKLMPGDDGVIVVHNAFQHSDYFHNEARVTNVFKGQDNGGQLPRELAEVPSVQMNAFLVEEETGERKLKRTEEDDRFM